MASNEEKARIYDGPDSIYLPQPPPQIHDPHPHIPSKPPKKPLSKACKCMCVGVAVVMLAVTGALIALAIAGAATVTVKTLKMAPPPKTCVAPKSEINNKNSTALHDILLITQGDNPSAKSVQAADSLKPQMIKAPQGDYHAIDDKRAIVLNLNEKWDPVLKMARAAGAKGKAKVNDTEDVKPEEIWKIITSKLEARDGIIKGEKLVELFKDEVADKEAIRKVIEQVASIITGFYYSPVARTFSFHMPSTGNGDVVMMLLRRLPTEWRSQLAFSLRVKQTASPPSSKSYEPNDPLLDFEWGLSKIGVRSAKGQPDPPAWSVTQGSKNVVVAVLDSGIDYKHKDLKDNMWVNKGEIPGNGIDDDKNGYVDDVFGYDFFNKRGDPMDDFGHGTHVAGIIGAVGNDGYGSIGVAPHVSLMALKILDAKGVGRGDLLQQAFDYAMLMDVHITSNSFSTMAKPVGQGATMKAMENRGILVVAAAGNDRRDNDVFPVYPGSFRYNNVLSVASSDQSDCMSSFTNYGDHEVDLAAPGSYIYSTAASSSGKGQEHVIMDGTSMAVPFVTGVGVLMLAAYEQQGVPIKGQGVALRQILVDTVDKLDAMKGHVVTGGRLNAAKAVQAVVKGGSTGAKLEGGDSGGAAKAASLKTDSVAGEPAKSESVKAASDKGGADKTDSGKTDKSVKGEPDRSAMEDVDGAGDNMREWFGDEGAWGGVRSRCIGHIRLRRSRL